MQSRLTRVMSRLGEIWDSYPARSWNILLLLIGLIILFSLNAHLSQTVTSRLKIQEKLLSRQSQILLGQAKVAIEGLSRRTKILDPNDSTTVSEFALACDILRGVGVDKLSILQFSGEGGATRARLTIMCPKGASIISDDVTSQSHVQEIIKTKRFVCSGVFKPVDIEIEHAVALLAPVLDEKGRMIGAVSALVHLDQFARFLVGDAATIEGKLRLIIEGDSVPDIPRASTVNSAPMIQPNEYVGNEFTFFGKSWKVALREPRPSVSWSWIVGWIAVVHLFGTWLVQRRWKTVIRFGRLVKMMQAIIFISRPDRTIVYANDYAIDRLGYSKEALIGSKGEDLVYEEDRAGVDEVFRRISGENFVRNRNRNLCNDGQVIWVEWCTCPIRDWWGRESETMSVGFDVTELILQSIPLPVLITRNDGTIVSANPEAVNFFGERVRFGSNFIDDIYEADREMVRSRLSSLAKRDRMRNRNIKSTGEVVAMTWTNCRLNPKKGEESDILSIGIDDTEEYRYRAMVELMEAAVYITDANKKVKYVNNYAKQLFGLEDDGLGHSLDEVIHEEDRERVLSFLQGPTDGAVHTIENRNRNLKSNVIYHMKWTNRLIDPDRGDASDLMSVGFDLTDRVSFVRRINHDILSPLSSLDYWTRKLEESELVMHGDVRPGFESHRVLKIIRNNGRFVSHLLRNLLAIMGNDHGSKLGLERVEFSAEGWINTVEDLLSSEFEDSKIKLQRKVQKNIRTIWGDRDICNLILLNLTKNALDALKRLPDNRDRKITISIKKSENFYEISIEDTGPGMSEEDKEKVKRLLDTRGQVGLSSLSVGLLTKSGWGLPIAVQHIRGHGGELKFSSMLRTGSIFWFTLPIENIQKPLRPGGPLHFALIGQGGRQSKHAKDLLGRYRDMIHEGDNVAELRKNWPNLKPDLIAVHLSKLTGPAARSPDSYRQWFRATPLLALVGDPKEAHDAREAGWDEVLVLPAKSHTFNEIVTRFLRKPFIISELDVARSRNPA